MAAGEFLQGYPAPLAAVIGFFGYLTTLAVYRLIFSPLKDVPGPRRAAVTAWYEFYWDCIKHGQYVFKIQELHKQYGMFDSRVVLEMYHFSTTPRTSCENQSMGGIS